jgi:hypothetical protein
MEGTMPRMFFTDRNARLIDPPEEHVHIHLHDANAGEKAEASPRVRP